MRSKNGKVRVPRSRWHAESWQAFDYTLTFGGPAPPRAPTLASTAEQLETCQLRRSVFLPGPSVFHRQQETESAGRKRLLLRRKRTFSRLFALFEAPFSKEGGPGPQFSMRSRFSARHLDRI